MTSLPFQNSINYEMPKEFYSKQNQKILKAIHNKMTPINMSPKFKLSLEREKQKARPTFNEFSYHKIDSGSINKHEKEALMEKRNKNNDSFSFLIDELTANRTLKKSIKSVNLKQSDLPDEQNFNEIDKIRVQRLPVIKKSITRKKEQLAKSIQNESLHFQRDNFKPIDQQRVYNLQYVINRLNVCQMKSKNKGKKNQPLRGYENLSPNKLKDYVELFKNKLKSQAQSIYVSKKRIALPKSNTEADQEDKSLLIRYKSSASTKENKSNKNSRKELRQTKKSFCQEMKTLTDIKRSLQVKRSVKI